MQQDRDALRGGRLIGAHFHFYQQLFEFVEVVFEVLDLFIQAGFVPGTLLQFTPELIEAAGWFGAQSGDLSRPGCPWTVWVLMVKNGKRGADAGCGEFIEPLQKEMFGLRARSGGGVPRCRDQSTSCAEKKDEKDERRFHVPIFLRRLTR